MNPWTRITDALPPEGQRVETMIADEDGVRNEAYLKRQGGMWFLDDGMYVYYRPTHWRMA